MVFLTQDRTKLVEVISVEVKEFESKFYLFGSTINSGVTNPIKLAKFDTEEEAKEELLYAALNGGNQQWYNKVEIDSEANTIELLK